MPRKVVYHIGQIFSKIPGSKKSKMRLFFVPVDQIAYISRPTSHLQPIWLYTLMPKRYADIEADFCKKQIVGTKQKIWLFTSGPQGTHCTTNPGLWIKNLHFYDLCVSLGAVNYLFLERGGRICIYVWFCVEQRRVQRAEAATGKQAISSPRLLWHQSVPSATLTH